ncbi:MAG: Flp pilus assembly protein CpaB [Rhodocyclales bacterium GWA2_65_20]|nr:MAG: Flp pilus assembly protein CpaB [Rhodocyclales bacterium GWA2_65_20]
MRSTRAYLMIGFSMLAGILAVLFGARWLAGQASMATQQVVVAARDLELGSVLDPSMLQVVSWPAGSIPAGTIGDVKALDTRVVRTSVSRGEPLLEAKLAPLGTKGGLSAVIGDGKRAITVKVNEVIGVAGFALPGNYVDVMVNIHDDKGKPISKIVLERILVLAVAQEAGRDETKPKVVSAVTVEVSPEQAEKLDLARSVGNLSLALRNQVDKSPVLTTGVRQDDLLHVAMVREVPPPAAAPVRAPAKARRAAPVRAPSRDSVEVIRGVQKSTAEL